ncbi:biotin-independent malonate decarboxylase subunit gamma [Utexia brackfieldae]|uniref:biotin-independent malonate decarboxylase subunit gamma n=1 Tax=Utexia brackfieldae TaxID=3074108 RepID=UPI00370D106A
MSKTILSRGDFWFSLLTTDAKLRHGQCASVKVADGKISHKPARFIAVVPDADNQFPRASQGEVGLLEGWTLAKMVDEVVEADKNKTEKTAIIAIIDVPSQAYGRREEAFGIHQALAGAAGAYAKARLAGHPVIGLIVGKAMSGAFLAHGYQANRLIAFNDDGVLIHAMGKASAARITLRSVESLERLAASIPPMAYDISSYSKLGLLYQLLNITNVQQPSPLEVDLVKQTLIDAINDTLKQGVDLSNRLQAKDRQASALVRAKMREQW